MVNVESLYHEVGQNIKARREQRGLTQEALASQVSLTRTSITNIEKGRQKLLLHTLIGIATALGTHPAFLLPRLAGQSQDEYHRTVPFSEPIEIHAGQLRRWKPHITIDLTMTSEEDDG